MAKSNQNQPVNNHSNTHSSSTTTNHGEHGDDGHISSYTQLLGVLVVLLALTGITILSAKQNFGRLNVWIALLIASSKTTVVVLYFMHLKYEKSVFKWMFLTSVFILAIFISFMFWDIGYRY